MWCEGKGKFCVYFFFHPCEYETGKEKIKPWLCKRLLATRVVPLPFRDDSAMSPNADFAIFCLHDAVIRASEHVFRAARKPSCVRSGAVLRSSKVWLFKVSSCYLTPHAFEIYLLYIYLLMLFRELVPTSNKVPGQL